MSLQDLLNKSDKVNLDAKTEKKVVMCAGVKDIKTGRGKALHPPDRDALELVGTSSSYSLAHVRELLNSAGVVRHPSRHATGGGHLCTPSRS